MILGCVPGDGAGGRWPAGWSDRQESGAGGPLSATAAILSRVGLRRATLTRGSLLEKDSDETFLREMIGFAA
jgi:hypothetical protein